MKINKILSLCILTFILLITNIGIVLATTYDSETVNPTTPVNVKAVPMGFDKAKISWNPANAASGYIVFKSSTKTGTYKWLNSTSSTSYTDRGLSAGKTYYYKVRTYKTTGAGNIYSDFSTIITVKIPSRRIVGYYAAWASYAGYTPDKIDTKKATFINYAFANIGSDYKVKLGFPDIDLSNFKKLNAQKKLHPKFKTIISVGGFSWSGRFSDVALTDKSRTTFANSCVDFLVKYGFDGVDIDWEYPVSGGLSTNGHRASDKTNFTLLMQKIRQKLDARGKLDGKHYVLSFAGGCSSGYINNTELQKLSKYVDYANVMTYDLHGMWDRYTDLNAPLFRNSSITKQYKWSVDDAMKVWMNAGFAKEKIVMGVPFYGYIYKAVTKANYGLFQTYSGGATISYQNIAKNYLNNSSYIKYFHKESKVLWLFNGSTFISYDNAQSMKYKADYIKAKGLGGAMVWELSQDPSGTLLNSLYNGLN